MPPRLAVYTHYYFWVPPESPPRAMIDLTTFLQWPRLRLKWIHDEWEVINNDTTAYA